MIDRRGLAVAGLLGMLGLGVTILLADVQIGGDAMSYYAYLRSAIVDGDLNLYNEDGNFNLYRQPMTPYYARTHTGYVHNQFSVGPAILLVPFFLGGHAWAKLTGLPTDGYAFPYIFAAIIGSIFYSTWGLALMVQLVRGFASRRVALWAAGATWLGSAITFYTFKDPLYSHATSFFAVSLLLTVWHQIRCTRNQSASSWLFIGTLLGLAALVRWQDVLFAVVPLSDLLLTAFQASLDRNSRQFLRAGRNALLVAAGALITFSPQVLAWQIIYQKWFVIPQGGSFLQWLRPHLGAVLFSPYHGLFIFTPLAALSVVGLLLLLRRNRPIAIVFLLSVALQAYVAGVAQDWWAGYSFGMRRMISCAPLLAVGLGLLLQEAKLARKGRVIYGGLLALLVLAVVWNLILVVEVGQRSWLDPEDRTFGFYLSAWRQIPRLVSNPLNFWRLGSSYLPTLGHGLLRRDAVILESALLLILAVVGGVIWMRVISRRVRIVPGLLLAGAIVIVVDSFVLVSARDARTLYALDIGRSPSPLLFTKLAAGSHYEGLLVQKALEVDTERFIQVTGAPVLVSRVELLWSSTGDMGQGAALELSIRGRDSPETARFIVDWSTATGSTPVQIQRWVEPYPQPAGIPEWLLPERFSLIEQPVYLVIFDLDPPLVPGHVALRALPGSGLWQVQSLSFVPAPTPMPRPVDKWH